MTESTIDLDQQQVQSDNWEEETLSDSDKLEFEVDQKTFASTLNKVFLSVDPKLPNLKNFLVEIDSTNGNLKFTGFNGSISVIGILPVVKLKTNLSKFCLDASALRTLIDKLPSNLLKVAMAGSRLTIKSGKNKYKLDVAASAQSFPVLPNETKEEIAIDLETLRGGIDRVSFACYPESHGGILNGVRIKLTKDKISFVGAHTALISRWELPVESESVAEIVIPLASVRSLNGLINLEAKAKDDDSPVTIKFEKKTLVRFVFESGTEFVSRLYSDAYPPVEKLIEDSVKIGCVDSILIDRKRWLESLERIKLMAELSLDASAAKLCDVLCLFGDDSVSLKLREGDDQRIDEELSCTRSNGTEPIRVIFSVHILMSILRVFKSDLIELKPENGLKRWFFAVDPKESEDQDNLDSHLQCLLAPKLSTFEEVPPKNA